MHYLMKDKSPKAPHVKGPDFSVRGGRDKISQKEGMDHMIWQESLKKEKEGFNK